MLQLNSRRESISGVSIDEEMIKMIKFQQAYNASARIITMVDEMLDTLNRMYGRKKKTSLGQVDGDDGPDLAERLRPLVEQAANGTLDTDGRARLERMVFSHWRERLDLPEDGDVAELHHQLKVHSEAGPLLHGLEDWLHRPPGTATADIPALLAPYRRPE